MLRLPVLCVAALLALGGVARADVLYDQTSAPAGGAANSNSTAPPGYSGYDQQTADDFVVPAGAQWSIGEVQTQGLGEYGPTGYPVLVVIYADSGGLPGAVVAQQQSSAVTGYPSDPDVSLSPALSVGAGTYWLSVQAVGVEWFWDNRSTATGSGAAVQNASSGSSCPTWTLRTTCSPGSSVDQVFALLGTSAAAGTNPPDAATPISSPAPISPVAPIIATPSPAPKRAAPSFTKVVTLATGSRCSSRRAITIHLKAPTGARLSKAKITINGRSPKTISGTSLSAAINLRGLPKGTYVVAITVTFADGRTVKGSRTYHTCVAKKRTKT